MDPIFWCSYWGMVNRNASDGHTLTNPRIGPPWATAYSEHWCPEHDWPVRQISRVYSDWVLR